MDSSPAHIGIKSSLDQAQLTEKLRVQPFPAVIELYLTRQDTDAEVRGTISRLLVSHPNLQVMLHSPITVHGGVMLAIDSPDYAALLRFAKLCTSHPAIIGGVMPTHTKGMPFLGMRVARNLEALRVAVPDIDNAWYFENGRGETGLEKGFRAYVARFNIQMVTVSVATWLAENSSDSLEVYLQERLDAQLPTYVHISDSLVQAGKRVPARIGNGEVAWDALAPLISFGVIASPSDPEQLGREMKADYTAFMDFKLGSVRRSLF